MDDDFSGAAQVWSPRRRRRLDRAAINDGVRVALAILSAISGWVLAVIAAIIIAIIWATR